MSEKRHAESKRRDEIQELFSAVHKSPISMGKDGRWRTRIRDQDGKLKLKAKTTLDEIERELRQAYLGDDEIDSERELATLATLYPRWLQMKGDEKNEERVSASTIERYESDWNNKISKEEKIINIPIRKLTEEQVKEWSNTLFRELSLSYFTSVKAVIVGVFDYAVKEGIITEEDNPARFMHQKDAKKRKMIEAASKGRTSVGGEITVYSAAEIKALEEAAMNTARNHKKISNPAIFYGVAFWIHTGLRPGELLALMPGDVRDGILTVRRMYCYHEDGRDKDGNKVVAIKPWLKSYKTNRSFALDHEAVAILGECQEMKIRKRYKNKYLFSINDMPVTHNKLEKTIKTVCRIAGVTYRRPYAIRDTWITTLVDSSRFTLAEIADMAGNSPAVIMQHYYGNRRKVTKDTDYMTEALRGLKNDDE